MNAQFMQLHMSIQSLESVTTSFCYRLQRRMGYALDEFETYKIAFVMCGTKTMII